MSQIALLPISLGFLIGISILPVLALIVQVFQRKKLLKREQERLKNTTFILSGSIEKQQLIPHVKSLCKLERQGVLHILTGRRKGYMLFRNGAIIDGFYRNTTEEAGARELFALTEGDYYFESRQVFQPDLIRKSINYLIDENNVRN